MKAGLEVPVHQAWKVFVPHASWARATSETSQTDSWEVQPLQREERGPAFSCLDEKDLVQKGSVPGCAGPREADSSGGSGASGIWRCEEHRDLHARIQCIHWGVACCYFKNNIKDLGL